MIQANKPRLVRVRRDRHAWTDGYFEALVGERIPFPTDGGGCLEGRLLSYVVDKRVIDLHFIDITEPERDPA